MLIIFLKARRHFASKGQDLVDFVATSASFVELALRVNFIITVRKEDVSEKLGLFREQVLQSSVRDVTACNAKLQLMKTSQTSTSCRYYEISCFICISLDPIRC